MKPAMKLAAVLVLAACNAADSASTESARAAEAAVQERLPIMGTAVQSGNVDALIDLWAPDVRLYESGVVMDGEAQARQIMGQFLGTLDVSNLTINAIETVAHDNGAVVYQFGYLTQTLKPSHGGPDIPVRNNFSLRWVPNADGVWEMHRYVSTVAPPDESAPQPVKTSRADVEPIGHEAAQAEVAQATGEYRDAVLSGDPARIAGIFTEDALFFEPEIQLIGRSAIQQFMTDVTSGYRVESLDIHPVETFIHDGGSVVYQYGGYSETTVEKATDRPTTTRNNYLARWRRGGDGRWLIDRFIATAQPDPSRQF